MNNNYKKIGIFGGSFNPIHRGHIEMADLAIKKLDLDILYLVPVGTPCHRSDKKFVSGKDRIKMIELSLLKNTKLYLCDYEVNTNKISYTYDTLLKIAKNHPRSIIYEIIGEDSAEYLNQWKNYDKMKELCQFVFFKRGGYFSNNSEILVIESPLFDVSSTLIRKKIESKKPLEKYLIPEVIEYIKEHELYK